jgi:hypothetical protein
MSSLKYTRSRTETIAPFTNLARKGSGLFEWFLVH